MEGIRSYVGKKIRLYRKEKRLTQKELGERVGVKHNTISSYENGTNETELDVLYKIANVLGRNIDEFFPPTSNVHQVIKNGNLSEDDLALIELIRKKALQLEGPEREKLMNNIKFAVDFFDNQ